jgi:hypothetical protein
MPTENSLHDAFEAVRRNPQTDRMRSLNVQQPILFFHQIIGQSAPPWRSPEPDIPPGASVGACDCWRRHTT